MKPIEPLYPDNRPISFARWLSYTLGLTLFLLCFLGLFAEGVTQLWTSGKDVWAHRYDVFIEDAIAAQATRRGYIKTSLNSSLSRDDIIEREAKAHKIHPDLIRAIITKESRGRQYATSESNAAGLMQVLRSWAPKLGLEHWSQLYDEETNIQAGAWIIGDNMRATKEDPYQALITYRVGPKGSAEKCNAECAQAYAKEVIKIMVTRNFK